MSESIDDRDARWRVLTAGIAVERELRESVALQTIINAFVEDQDRALDALIEVSPSDSGRVAQLQAIIRQSRIVRLALQGVLQAGIAAETSLRDEDEHMEQSPV